MFVSATVHLPSVVAWRAHGLHVFVVFGCVAEVVVVLVAWARALVPTVGARKVARSRDQSGLDEVVDAPPGLRLVAIPGADRASTAWPRRPTLMLCSSVGVLRSTAGRGPS
jgi:hypothetical protein